MWIFQKQILRSSLAIPFPDESIIANLDNNISIFKAKDVNKYPSEEDLQRTLDDLKMVKAALAQIICVSEEETMETADESQEEISASDSSSSRKDVPTSFPINQTIENSMDMLKNGGKFTKPIDKKNSQKKRENPPVDSIIRRSMEIPNNKSADQSSTSLRNSMTITPLLQTCRKSPQNHKLITRKINSQTRLKKTGNKVKNLSKQSRNSELNKLANDDLETSSPKIISTLFATCRIHSYDNKSHTFEIIKPKRRNPHDEAHEKSAILVVVLANGQTALFTSKSGANILSLGESQ